MPSIPCQTSTSSLVVVEWLPIFPTKQDQVLYACLRLFKGGALHSSPSCLVSVLNTSSSSLSSPPPLLRPNAMKPGSASGKAPTAAIAPVPVTTAAASASAPTSSASASGTVQALGPSPSPGYTMNSAAPASLNHNHHYSGRPSTRVPHPSDRHYQRPTPSFYPMPYPLSYPPSLPAIPPASQSWSLDRPHRYVVCRICDTILLCLTNLPTTVHITRHFTDDIPVSISQVFLCPPNPTKVHHADALMWLRRPFAGLFRYDASRDKAQSAIPMACRGCGTPAATLIVTFDIADAEHAINEERRKAPHISKNQHQHSSNNGNGNGKNGGNAKKSCVRLKFKAWAVFLSDAYGREISAAAEANGFWNHTPAPFAGRPFPQR